MHSSICSKTRKTGGFTLIELLVVIAIIAILAAILFPVFNKARDSAKMSRCLVHLNEIGKAVLSYCDDNNGRFPIGPHYTYDGSGNPVSIDQSGWTGQLIGGMNGGTPVKAQPKDRPLYRYTSGNLEIWKCPSEVKQWCAAQPYDNVLPSIYWGTSYTMNGAYAWNGENQTRNEAFYTLMGNGTWGGGGAALRPRTLSEVNRPTKIWMVGEKTMHHYWTKHWPSTGNTPRLPLGHQGDKPFSPVVYCDGHSGIIHMERDLLVDPNGRWAFCQKGWNPKWPTAGL